MEVNLGEGSTFAANSALLSSDVIDFAMLLTFGGKQFNCLMSCDLKVSNESACNRVSPATFFVTKQKIVSLILQTILRHVHTAHVFT